MANDPNPNMFGGFQLPGLQMPAFSQTSLADNPVMNTLTGSMDFMKNLWGASGNSLGSFAGFVTPTLDIEQLDRKITDLKAVEGWLQTNASMLRATIQALEVQRNTIVTLQSFGNMAADQANQMAQAASPPSGSGKTGSAPPASSVPPGWPMPPAPAASTRAQPVPEPSVEDETDPDDDPDFESPPDTAQPEIAPPPVSAQARTAAKRKSAPGKDAAPSVAQGAALAGQATSASIQNATAWWNMLQDQFAKVAHAAVASSQTAPGKGKAAGTAAKRGKAAAQPSADHAAPATKVAAKKAATKQAGAKKPAAKRAASKSTKAAPPARKAGTRS